MSHFLKDLFDSLHTSELSMLRVGHAQLTRERDVYLESLQHVQARADQLGHQNRKLARLLPVALAADALVECLAEVADNKVQGKCLCEACAEDVDALDNAVDKVQDILRAERDRRFAARHGGAP